jgi:hypothetical protein
MKWSGDFFLQKITGPVGTIYNKGIQPRRVNNTIYDNFKNKFVPVTKYHATMGSGGKAPTTDDLGTRIVCTK